MKNKAEGFISEFKQFSMKGNVVDLAVGVIIGGAFNKIVSSLVNDIIMPIIGALIGGVDFTHLSYTLREIPGKEEAAILKYGTFIQNVVDFLIIALSIFIMVKVINKLNIKKQEQEEIEAEKAEKKLSKEEELLTEIRDLLKNK